MISSASAVGSATGNIPRNRHTATPILITHDDHLFAEECVDLPLIDFRRISEGDNAETKKLAMAAKNWGFLQLVNHGISRKLLRKIEEQAYHAFALPLEAKTRATEMPDSGVFHGYLPNSHRMDASSMHFNEAIRFPLNPQQRGGLISKLWPAGNEPFSSTMEKYIAAVEPIFIRLLKALAYAIGLDPLYFVENISKDGHTSVFRMNFYPGIISKSQSNPSPTLGLRAHSDPQLLTITYQNCVDGLQILKDDRWISVSGFPGSFTVNVGDLLQVMSNDLYKSVVHRVVMNRDEFRFSFVFGMGLHPKAIVRPAPQLIKAQQPQYYRPFTADLYFETGVAHKIYDNTHLDMFREPTLGIM